MTTFPMRRECTLLEVGGKHRVSCQALRGQVGGGRGATKEPLHPRFNYTIIEILDRARGVTEGHYISDPH